MGKILTITAYVSCGVFLVRLIWHALSWVKSEKRPSAGPGAERISAGTIAEALLDMVFFRRLFKTNRVLWIASWTFHISLLFILLRHAWYFMDPVPEFIILIEPAGIKAGYVLPFSLILLLLLRIAAGRDRYISQYNIFLITVLFMISITGLSMGIFFQPDVLDVKDFISGILAFKPYAVPDSPLFVVHFILVLILIPILPFHLITAPVITMEARRREDGLDLVIHEK
jgi:nitrate reductase gamma subunit